MIIENKNGVKIYMKYFMCYSTWLRLGVQILKLEEGHSGSFRSYLIKDLEGTNFEVFFCKN